MEVVPDQGRLPLYFCDSSAPQKIQFKFAESDRDGGFDDSMFEWSKPFKTKTIGRVSIKVSHSKWESESANVLVIKQVNNATQTIFIIFRLEDQQMPTYRIQNSS